MKYHPSPEKDGRIVIGRIGFQSVLEESKVLFGSIQFVAFDFFIEI